MPSCSPGLSSTGPVLGVAVSIEGTRSYGAGLARAVAAAGLLVIECEYPDRKQRRGKGKSDPIDAHLAVLTALGLDADRLPTPRADGDREAPRILLNARQEITTTTTGQINRLRALLLTGDDTERHMARGRLTPATLTTLIKRRLPRDASREQAIRYGELRRLALALREASHVLKANRAQLQAIVNDLAPGLTNQRGIGPVSAAQAIVSFSHLGRCRNDAAFAALAGTSPLPAAAESSDTGSCRGRPPPEPRHPHHRHQQNAPLPQNPRLPRATHRRRQNPRLRISGVAPL
jgi:transposase